MTLALRPRPLQYAFHPQAPSRHHRAQSPRRVHKPSSPQQTSYFPHMGWPIPRQAQRRRSRVAKPSSMAFELCDESREILPVVDNDISIEDAFTNTTRSMFTSPGLESGLGEIEPSCTDHT